MYVHVTEEQLFEVGCRCLSCCTVCVSVCYVQELGKEFVKSVKVVPTRLSTSSLSSFSIALALSVARIHRFEDSVSHSLIALVCVEMSLSCLWLC